MPEALHQQLGFDPEDVAHLEALRPHISAVMPHIVDRFYDVATRQPETRRVIGTDTDGAARLRASFEGWLAELFDGSYDDAYWNRRAALGKVQVRIGLSQRFMLVAMEAVWQELEQHIRDDTIAEPAAKRRSLHKLLTLGCGRMNIRVLIVEDESLIRWPLRQKFEERGYRVTEAEDGRGAMNALDESIFDLIMLDYRLPDKTGLDVLRQIRETDAVVIMITAFSTIENAVEAIKPAGRFRLHQAAQAREPLALPGARAHQQQPDPSRQAAEPFARPPALSLAEHGLL